MTSELTIVSPVDGSIYASRPAATANEVARVFNQAAAAQRDWAPTSIAERAELCARFVDAFVAMQDDMVPELSWQMGRPISAGAGEIRGFEERARHMISIAEDALAPLRPSPIDGFDRYIERSPLGVVFVIAAWNYPYLIAVNSVVPALMAGNAVVLKHSSQTLLCAERFQMAFDAAGLPPHTFQTIHTDHATTAAAIQHPNTSFVAFTGSVAGGHSIQQAAANRFIGVGLELGGKDPAYVRADANLSFAVENLVDGAFFNSGQSCCAKERLYVHGDIYDQFVEAFVSMTSQYRLGNPLDPDTNLGPMVRTSAAQFVQTQIDDACHKGARALIDTASFSQAKEGSPYQAPQVLVDVDHSMDVMTEESFGPVIGIMKVRDDDEAIRLMNDSPFGLTASVWTEDADATRTIGGQINTGTWFMNRCDYLDPSLAWTGVGDSGRGCTLSKIGYEQLTRPKSFHLRLST